MNSLEVFGGSTAVRVDVSNFFWVGTAVLKQETGAESESEKLGSARLWCQAKFLTCEFSDFMPCAHKPYDSTNPIGLRW